MLATLRDHNAMAERWGQPEAAGGRPTQPRHRPWAAAPVAAHASQARADACVLPPPCPPLPCSIKHRQLGTPLGQMLWGKSVLLVGLGNIGKELAVRYGWQARSACAAACCGAAASWGLQRHARPGARSLRMRSTSAAAASAAPRRLRVFGVRVTALRRRPWHGQGSRRQLHQQPGQQQQRQAAAEDAMQPTESQALEGFDPSLDAAAEAVLADRGCWPRDCGRLAAEADVIAGAPLTSCAERRACMHACLLPL